MQSAIDAVQVFGGNGYVRDYPVEKLMRDAKELQNLTRARARSKLLVIARSLTKVSAPLDSGSGLLAPEPLVRTEGQPNSVSLPPSSTI
jgi:hypothetical protein